MPGRFEILGHYWGKARPDYEGEPKWHPLVYHCLDVAAVAAVWWDTCPALRGRFAAAFPGERDPDRLRAWVLFFIALHDLGKFDLRFQLKAFEVLFKVLGDDVPHAWREIQSGSDGSPGIIKPFDHGRAGLVWAKIELANWCHAADAESYRDSWLPWLIAVTAHHGDYLKSEPNGLDAIEADEILISRDRQSRHAFVVALAEIFLVPSGLSLQGLPSACSLSARALLAGFCACCDWMGSNEKLDFPYRTFDSGSSLSAYLIERVKDVRDNLLIERNGLIAQSQPYAGVDALLNPGEQPRGVQTLVDALPVTAGLTLIEAPTGSGKTEAALAYAWRLLGAGVVDSIVFALPTQATANAMLVRAEAFAERAYGRANVVLAHGKRALNDEFWRLADVARHTSVQGAQEAGVQCAAWLANSRKVVFLGQIGVCTVDQVLLSVLPVRHKFMRGFGLAKSLLIVDEVHAYDAYMHGLLGEVLRAQRMVGGSAVLLSATLPKSLRNQLLSSCNAVGVADATYPALWHATGSVAELSTVSKAQRPSRLVIETECLKLAGAFPDDVIIERIVAAAKVGAQVAVIMNVVDDAQRLARTLRTRVEGEQLDIGVDLFHARFRFVDRQEKERACVERYGRNGKRDRGRILVATQVVEQSLDLDFDWLLTQICPVDLLFQRLGRLHRHVRERPVGFEVPHCTVLSVEGDDYGVHKVIYGNTRVLWRTEELLRSSSEIVFPEAYRGWIDRVYERDDWEGEPFPVSAAYDVYSSHQIRRREDAQRLTTMTASSFRDEEAQITSLTRDGEMSLSVLPVQRDGSLLDGQRLGALAERHQAEVINMNTVPVPHSWKNSLRGCVMETEGSLAGCYQLEMSESSSGIWRSSNGDFSYSSEFGLGKHSGGVAPPE